jgi:hypothetical protein
MDQTIGPNEKPTENGAERIILGAAAIAEYIFGDPSLRRKVYYLAEFTKVPIWRLGAQLCLRPATYENWIVQQESRTCANGQRRND